MVSLTNIKPYFKGGEKLSLVPRGLFFNGTSINYAETMLVIPFAVKLVLVSTNLGVFRYTIRITDN